MSLFGLSYCPVPRVQTSYCLNVGLMIEKCERQSPVVWWPPVQIYSRRVSVPNRFVWRVSVTKTVVTGGRVRSVYIDEGRPPRRDDFSRGRRRRRLIGKQHLSAIGSLSIDARFTVGGHAFDVFKRRELYVGPRICAWCYGNDVYILQDFIKKLAQYFVVFEEVIEWHGGRMLMCLLFTLLFAAFESTAMA